MKRKNEEVNILGDENLAQAILRISNDVLDVLVGEPTKRKHEEKPKHGMELPNTGNEWVDAHKQQALEQAHGDTLSAYTTGMMLMRNWSGMYMEEVIARNRAMQESGLRAVNEHNAGLGSAWNYRTETPIPFDPLDHEQESQ